MKKSLQHVTMLLLTLCLGMTATSFAQPDLRKLRPVILGDTLLCPNAGSTLRTQKIYDTYQWYKRDYFSDVKELIPGATTNELVVDNDDILKYFSVVVTLKGYKRSSDERLIDGLVFLLPAVQSGGDFKNGPGYFVLNEGDTGLFTLMQPYDTSITWYRNAQPMPGETSNELKVTKAGSYTVSGAPSVCPDFIQYLGVDLIVKVRQNNKVPIITGDTMLCPDSKGTLTTQTGYSSYQWYKRFYGSNEKLPVKGATGNTIDINTYDDAGAYFSVKVTSNSDTLTSEEKLVDSYVFLLPSVISDGDFINGPGYFLLNQGDTGTFTLTQPYDTNITWYRNGAAIPGENAVTLNVTRGGNYTVQGAPSVCPDFLQNPGVVLIVKLVTEGTASSSNALKQQLKGKEIKLYPNPAKDFVMIDVAASAGKNIDVTLTAQDGKIAFAKQYTNAPAGIKLDLANIQAGVYYVRAGDGLIKQVLKLVVTK